MAHHGDKIFRWAGYTVATVIIIFASLVAIGDLFTPVLNKHKAEIESWGSQLLDAPITIGQIHLSWDWYEPEVSLDKVSILDKQTLKPDVDIEKVKINLAILRSLFAWKPMTESIKISGVQFTVHQVNAGQFQINGLKQFTITDNFTGANVEANDVFDWIFTIPRLMMRDIYIHYIPLQGPEKFVTLKKIGLENDSLNHQLSGQAVLNQETPTRVVINLAWNGSIHDLEHISANLYLYLEGVSLPQWLGDQSWHQMQINEGLGSVKIWAEWNQNQLQKVQTTLQIFEMEWTSLLTHKTQYIPRLSGNFGWKREGDHQVIAGDNIFIDLSQHLWPMTNFSVHFKPLTDGTFAVQSAALGYLDARDVIVATQDTGFMPESLKKTLSALSVRGELRNVRVATTTNWDDISNISLSTDFSGIALNEWQKFPAVKNMSGNFSWDGKQGNLNLNSKTSEISYSPLFANALRFEQLAGKVQWQQDDKKTWTIQGKDLKAINEDVRVYTTLTLTLPEKESPEINLTADFRVLNAARINHYMPVKLYDPDLQQWLSQAFLSGKLESGNAVVQGKLSDFPFDDGKGKFQISGVLNNIDLNYAPKWPLIKNINGTIDFSGRLLSVDVTQGQMLDVPLKNIHAEIPNLGGKDPEILTVTSDISGDLSQGLNFIHQSPLQDTLGKDLSSLDLQGPMNLNLKLLVPLTKSENTKVVGTVNTSDGVLNLPDWNLKLDHLQGTFQFTEATIQATQMHGNLFDSPITLDLATQPGKNSYVKANLQGNISIPVLQQWTKVPMSSVVSGATQYQAELHLASHDTNQDNEIILKSDLKGITVNLPDNYGKKADDVIDFKMNLFASINKPIRLKMNYGKLLSAALTLQKTKSDIKLLGGELRLGEGANWQTQPGILLGGNIDSLNWDKIQQYLPNQKSGKNNFDSSLLRGIDVTIGTLDLMGQRFNQIRVQIEKAKSNWQVGLNSATVAGHVIVPNNFQNIQAKFDRLFLEPSTTKTEKPLDPRTFPAFSFLGADVRYGNKHLGRVILNVSPTKSGLAIKQLDLDSGLLKLHSSGSWQMLRGSYVSRLEGDASTKSMSDFLTDWGFDSSNFVGKNATAKFDLSWSGAPFQPTEQGLSGSLSLNLEQGRIVNVGDSGAKMGLGRMLNLFSLQTIPRRLSLDFSDLFEKGYSFDSMKGNFSLKNGNAFTKDTRFDGPVARIDISGRIGLAAKDFDIKLGVTPYVTSSLPVVATIASSFNPIAGAAAWFVDRVISHEVSKVTTHEYKIQGPWDAPIWGEAGK